MEGLERLRAKFTIDLHPSKLANAREGVRAHLSSLLLRYSEDLDGVLLSYRNERVLTQAASIHPYFPFVRLDVVADVVLFRPRPGMRLVGTVNKVGADFVGLLVLGFLNAAVAADAIRPEFRPRPAEQCWASTKAAAHRLEVGTKVHFDVAAVRHHGAFLSIAGSLQQPGTGAEGWAKPPKRGADAGEGGGGGGKKQQRQGERGQQQAQQQAQQQGQLEQALGKKKDKKKKRQREEEAAMAPQQQAQQQAQPPAAVTQEAPTSKKTKKGKQQQQQHAAAELPDAAAAAPGAGAAGDGKKKKEKKRKADDAPAPAAPANGSAEPQQQKKKKKRKEGA